MLQVTKKGVKSLALIDGANIQKAFYAIGQRADWAKIRDWLEGNFDMLRLNYYTALREEDDGEIKLHPLVNWLGFNGYSVVSKPAKRYTDNGVERTKGNMDIELATDMLMLSSFVSQIFLFSGDADFSYVVREVQKRGVRVVAICTVRGNGSSLIADDLRKQCDGFIDIAEMPGWYQERKAAAQ